MGAKPSPTSLLASCGDVYAKLTLWGKVDHKLHGVFTFGVVHESVCNKLVSRYGLSSSKCGSGR
jgi:hypothetical protein